MRPVRRIAPSGHLLVSPDGALSLIPFAALVDEHGAYAIERYTITYLTSGRDVLRLRESVPSATGAVVVADPKFGNPVVRRAAREGGAATHIDESQYFFAPLPGVASEVRALRQLLPQATFLTGDEATKPRLMAVRGPAVLHIATHGFFLSDAAAPQDDVRAGGDDTTRLARMVGHATNPLVRSGLALTGANASGASAGEGVLTALEAAGLDLWGTKLVVLSACDTGVGTVRNGDGVYGLRRAFVLAGAESQLMTLWPVSDRRTRDLMVSFYSTLLRGTPSGEALRDAQLAMLHAAHVHPYYWASFILSGRWTALERQP
jgi:CHAT domain-containing protein